MIQSEDLGIEDRKYILNLIWKEEALPAFVNVLNALKSNINLMYNVRLEWTKEFFVTFVKYLRTESDELDLESSCSESDEQVFTIEDFSKANAQPLVSSRSWKDYQILG